MAEQRSPKASPAPSALPDAPEENALWKFILTPITLISFLVSLALISERNLAQRNAAHAHGPYPDTTLGKTRTFLHALVFRKVSGGPYEYVRSPNPSSKLADKPKRGSGSGSGSGSGDEPWHWHSRQRQMMKAEMEDAFRVRKTVVAVLASVVVGALVLLAFSVRWVWQMVGNWTAKDL